MVHDKYLAGGVARRRKRSVCGSEHGRGRYIRYNILWVKAVDQNSRQGRDTAGRDYHRRVRYVMRDYKGIEETNMDNRGRHHVKD